MKDHFHQLYLLFVLPGERDKAMPEVRNTEGQEGKHAL